MSFACLIKIPNQSDGIDIRTVAEALSKKLASVFEPNLALVHTPSTTKDRYTNDGVSQYNIVEIHSSDLPTIEENLPHIKQILVAIGVHAEPIIQIMLAREFETPAHSGASLHNMVSYFVEYSGKVESDIAWTNHYISSHVDIMKRLPRIKDIVVFTPLMWLYPEHTRRFESLLCNRVSFPQQIDLESALKSPIRDEMRKDYDTFPSFEGECTHFAMDTYILINQSSQYPANNPD
jgi:hypothetical protein